ncbi:S1/P1 nuclease [Chitinophaga skermanii]|uniref:S1/P1 nuclease n=1 Tax=Chitinophaga skermanii TaxID=331697 RepID=A0A327QD19_9BACT|nr:S1/P1 nuclease [Chitinophaga skermanii]RAJ01684.1 S1/P1 nuclease [Chitinophaga skermanii]
MHKKIAIKKMLVLAFALFITTSSYAWGPIGHRVVAELASRHLTPRAQKAISDLIGTETLAMIANWPDFIKSDTTGKYKHTNNWHYVDFPGHISCEEVHKMIADGKASGEAYNQIVALSKTLKDPKASKEDKVFALTFLVHIIGDVHQPLHVGRDEDQGGNKIAVQWFNTPSNLHRVWDEQLIDYQQLSYTEYTNWLDRAPAQKIKEIQKGTVIDWLCESHVLADKVYASTKDGDKLSYRYNFLFVNDLNSQLQKGGYRLAQVLNDIFK